jgi:hypothetical protein
MRILDLQTSKARFELKVVHVLYSIGAYMSRLLADLITFHSSNSSQIKLQIILKTVFLANFYDIFFLYPVRYLENSPGICRRRFTEGLDELAYPDPLREAL